MITDMYTIEIPGYIRFIMEQLNQHGFQAYVVGGCVRDSILQRTPNDWDVTTDAAPAAVMELFQKTVDTGMKHGTVTVLLDGESCEVTTFRVDGPYEDHRRPDSVRFTDSLEADLARRDFTINAMAYHPDKGLMDPFSGAADLEDRTLRTVGNADERFNEDALRMLRAVRFSAQLDFSIHPTALDSIRNNCKLIRAISAERVREELTKALTSAHAERFELLQDTGLLTHVLPEFVPCFSTPQHHPYHVYDVAHHTLSAVSHVENTPLLRWVMLLHDIGKPPSKTTDEKGIDHFYGHPFKSLKMAERIMKRLKFDNRTLDQACRLITYHDLKIKPDEKSVRKAVYKLGEDIFPNMLKVKAADVLSQNPEYAAPRLAELDQIREIYQRIKESGQCLSLKDLAVDGNDLIAMGIKDGKTIGITLSALLDKCLDEPELNTRERLLSIVTSSLQK